MEFRELGLAIWLEATWQIIMDDDFSRDSHQRETFALGAIGHERHREMVADWVLDAYPWRQTA